MTGVDEAEFTTHIYDEVTTELTGVVAVRVVEFLSLQPAGEIQPYCARTSRAQFRAFESISVVDCPLAVEQNSEVATGFFEPFLHGGEGSKGKDKNMCIQFGKFVLLFAQLCDMLTAGYSAKVTEKDQQGISAFENFAEGDLLAFGGGEGKGGGGVIKFQVSGSRCQVRARFAQMSL